MHQKIISHMNKLLSSSVRMHEAAMFIRNKNISNICIMVPFSTLENVKSYFLANFNLFCLDYLSFQQCLMTLGKLLLRNWWVIKEVSEAKWLAFYFSSSETAGSKQSSKFMSWIMLLKGLSSCLHFASWNRTIIPCCNNSAVLKIQENRLQN